jgi:AcrR family transcriptional regulator
MARRTSLREVGAQGRDAWIEAALDVLGEEGIDGVRVEAIARKLQITKGSFYHHFEDRDALHEAMLERWRQRLVVRVIEHLEAIGDPDERFHQLMHAPYELARADRDLDLAVMLWARRDGRAAAALDGADRIRTEFIARALVACGVDPQEAPARACLALAFLRAAPGLGAADFAVCERLLLSSSSSADTRR